MIMKLHQSVLDDESSTPATLHLPFLATSIYFPPFFVHHLCLSSIANPLPPILTKFPYLYPLFIPRILFHPPDHFPQSFEALKQSTPNTVQSNFHQIPVICCLMQAFCIQGLRALHARSFGLLLKQAEIADDFCVGIITSDSESLWRVGHFLSIQSTVWHVYCSHLYSFTVHVASRGG